MGIEAATSVLSKKGSEDENLAAYVCGINDLKVHPFKLAPTLGDTQVKVRIKAVRICGSDVHYVKHLRCGDYIVKEPMVIGHECAGIIEEVGNGVKNVAVGDRVALEPGIACNNVLHPADMCFKLPENISLEEGAMCEPLSVGVHACHRASVGPKTKVLILEAGPIGLVTLLTAHAYGSPKVIVADIAPERLKVAKELGANATVQLSTLDNDNPNLGLSYLSKDGLREVDILGIFRYRNTYPLCLVLLSSGRINVKPLITHRFGFNQKDVVSAFETSAKGGNAIKVMFNL